MTEWLWPLLGGLLTAAVAGPLGSLLLWRRMAYFGDSLAHASLFGVALALLLDLPMGPMVAGVCLLAALLLSRMLTSLEHGGDTWLAIIAYSGLSLALVLSALHNGSDGHDLEDYLFGNLLSLDLRQLAIMSAGLLITALLLLRNWTGLVAQAVSEETAQVDGWPVQRLRPLLLVLLAVVVAAGAKVMGVLLISALLVIPAAAARYIARSPGQMAMLASLLGIVGIFCGVGIGHAYHLPPAPLVVLSGMVLLIVLMLWSRYKPKPVRV